MTGWCRCRTPEELEHHWAQAQRLPVDERWRRMAWCLSQDPRSQVRRLAQARSEWVEQRLAAPENHLYRYEKVLWNLGYLVGGVDEVGRGSLAGPVIAGAVVFRRFSPVWQVADSKTLTAQHREAYLEIIGQQALTTAVGHADSAEVDSLNVYWATRYAMQRAILQLEPQPGHLLVDAMSLDEVPIPAWSLIKGDARSGSIAAASILAKVVRDRIMVQLHDVYPEYGFHQHKGYATAQHWEALVRHGPCPAHRLTYEPVRRALQLRGVS